MRNLLQAMKDGYGLLTGEGQFLVFFLLALYILWFFKKNEIKELKRYATVTLLFLLFPLTAKGLMLYATAFYGYAELWVLLPVTLVTGFMFTGFTFEWAPELPFLRKYPVRREAVCIAAMAVLLFLCGTLSVMPVKTQVASMGHVLPKETEEILEEYVCDGIPEGEKVWLLAPDDIMAYARIYDGRICLPYGRFLWEKELSAYTYDSYAADTEELHGWVNGTLTGMDEVEISENYLSMCSSKEITVLVFEKERLTTDGLAEALDKQDSYRHAGETDRYVVYRLAERQDA